MKTIKDFLNENTKLVKGPVNDYELTEKFDTYIEIQNTYTILHKKNKACIVEAKRIGEGKYAFLYQIVNIIYPNNYPNKLKLDVQVNDIFAEQKFYHSILTLEKSKIEYDTYYQKNNKYKFYPLTDLQMANNWYENLSKEEQKYVNILIQNKN